MPSKALDSLELGLHEIDDLLRADPTPKGRISPDPPLSRAVLRSSVVLLCAHFERYIHSVNEEAIALINSSNIPIGLIPEVIKLEHSRRSIDILAGINWANRAVALAQYTTDEAWLWGPVTKGEIDHQRVLQWMKSPKPKSISRFYRAWGVQDVFTAITRKSTIKRRFYLKISELVEKRNNIAHGDFSTEATIEEVREYLGVVRLFCGRVDRRLSSILKTNLALPCTWY